MLLTQQPTPYGNCSPSVVGCWVSVVLSLFLWVLRCFTSPGSLRVSYVFRYGSSSFTRWGFPIRTSPDHRLFATSPKRFAGYRVLHRLLAAKPSTVRPYVLWPSDLPCRMTGGRRPLRCNFSLLQLCVVCLARRTCRLFYAFFCCRRTIPAVCRV